jgi:hypothetical protein
MLSMRISNNVDSLALSTNAHLIDELPLFRARMRIGEDIE